MTIDERRGQIDAIDRQILDLLQARLKLCMDVGELKAVSELDVMQHGRVEEVLAKVTSGARDRALDGRFAESLWRLIISEACRLEDSARQSQPAHGLTTSAVRIDHVAIAVHDIEQAISLFRDRFGFSVSNRQTIEGNFSGMLLAVMSAGGVTLVLVQGTSEASNVSQYIERYGPGVQHVAIEVAGIDRVRDELSGRGLDFLSGVIAGPGLDQLFTRRDRNSGIQIEFVERSGNNSFEKQNIKELFKSMERENEV